MDAVTLPHKFRPRPYQLELFRAMQNGAKRAVIVWHRRAGKDKACLNLLIKLIAEKEAKGTVGTYFYFFPTFAQGRKVLWDGIDRDGFAFLDHFPKEFIRSKNDTQMQVVTKKGSVFQIIGTDNVDSVMGTNPIGCVFSEYALQNPKAWQYIRPILAENQGWAIFNFTPRGMNHGYHLLQQAKESGWFHQVLTVDDTEVITKDMLEAEKQQMPEDLFRQEYLCAFLEGAGQFFRRVTDNISSEPWRINPAGKYVLGVDLAKHRDYTVIAPLDLTTGVVGTLERFNQIDYALQQARIEAAYLQYNRALVRIDSTGVGEPVHDNLVAKGLNMEAYHFTEVSRRDLLMNLQVLLSLDIIKLPNDEQLISELQSMHLELSERGKIRIEVPEGLHDDCVMAVALAAWQFEKQKGLANIRYEASKPIFWHWPEAGF